MIACLVMDTGTFYEKVKSLGNVPTSMLLFKLAKPN
jgi:hypothetical protein